jgi:hypothetical protein
MYGYEKYQLVSLEEAVQPLHDLVPKIQDYVYVAKENSDNPAEGLTQDESASIKLYTMDWEPFESCLHRQLNETLRSEDRQLLKPYFSYLKLMLTALHRLPSFQGTVWRGIKMDISKHYQKGARGVWWGFSSATPNGNALENEQFLGQTGARSLFSIQCINGKQVKQHSTFPDEEEVLLMPGFYYEVTSILKPAHDMHLINLKEIDASY